MSSLHMLPPYYVGKQCSKTLYLLCTGWGDFIVRGGVIYLLILRGKDSIGCTHAFQYEITDVWININFRCVRKPLVKQILQDVLYILYVMEGETSLQKEGCFTCSFSEGRTMSGLHMLPSPAWLYSARHIKTSRTDRHWMAASHDL